MQFLARFAVGGLLIATLPVIASRFGNRMAGLVAVFPITIGISLIVLLQSRGATSAKAAALSSLYSLPATAAFLLVVIFAVNKFSFMTVLILGILGWFVVAGRIYWLSS